MKNKLISIGLACFMFVSLICPVQSFASTNGFTSDTTKDFEIHTGSDYTLKVTPDNTKANVSVTTGDGNVARIINSIKKDNNYYVIVHATGNKNDKTNLYVNLGNKPIRLCTITVAYPIGITGQHMKQVVDKDGNVNDVKYYDKGWQLRIECKDIHYQDKTRMESIKLSFNQSSVNQNEKYFIVHFGGDCGTIECLIDHGFTLINSSGKQLEIKPYGENQFKVSYDNINDVKEMYFGTDTEKAKLTMVEFK